MSKAKRTVFATEKHAFCSVNIAHEYAVEALRKSRNKSQVMHHGLSRVNAHVVAWRRFSYQIRHVLTCMPNLGLERNCKTNAFKEQLLKSLAIWNNTF